MILRPISGTDLSALSLRQKPGAIQNQIVENSMPFDNNEGLQLNFNICQFPGVIVTHLFGRAETNNTLVSEDPSQSLSMNFQLNGSVNSNLTAYGRSFDINPAQHNLLYVKYGAGNHTFLKGDQQTLHFRLDLNYFIKLFGDQEELFDGVLNKIHHQESFLANYVMMPILPEMNLALKSILTCPLHGQFKKVYLEGKVLELLALGLAQSKDYKPPVKSLTVMDVNKIHEVRNYLDLNFLLPLSLLQLAKEFGLNDFKLKKGFRDIYQTTVFGYIHQKRMKLSLNLLSEKVCSVNEIADIVGYKNANHFSTAFKNFFGFSPTDLKK